MNPDTRRTVRRMAQWVWIALIVAFMGWYVLRHFSEFQSQDWTLSPGWAAAAVFWALLRRWLAGLMWANISLHDIPHPPRSVFWDHMRIYFLSNLASYLPGTVWYMASRIQQSRQRGHTTLRTSIGLVFETGLLLWSGFMVGLGAMDRLAPVPRGVVFLGFGLMALITLAATHPRAINLVLAWLLRLLRRPAASVAVSWRWGLSLWGLSLGIWVCWGLSLLCLLKALGVAVGAGHLAELTSAFALSWVIGFLTPWAPSGMGIREGVLFLFLTPYSAQPVAVVAAVATRLITILEDVFWALVSLALRPGKDSPDEKPTE